MHPVIPVKTGIQCAARRREEALCGQDCPLLDPRLREDDGGVGEDYA